MTISTFRAPGRFIFGVGAVETLTGYRFPYDSRASGSERQEALERLKENACRIAEFQKRFEQREAGR